MLAGTLARIGERGGEATEGEGEVKAEVEEKKDTRRKKRAGTRKTHLNQIE
jgi:hypothetical protein